MALITNCMDRAGENDNHCSNSQNQGLTQRVWSLYFAQDLLGVSANQISQANQAIAILQQDRTSRGSKSHGWIRLNSLYWLALWSGAAIVIQAKSTAVAML